MSGWPARVRSEAPWRAARSGTRAFAAALDAAEATLAATAAPAILRADVLPMVRAAARRGANPVRVLDISGTTGWWGRAVATQARVPTWVTVIERDAAVAADIRRRTGTAKGITVAAGDAREVLCAAASADACPAPGAAQGQLAVPGPYDVVVAGDILHTHGEGELADWLGLIDAVARHGWVATDLVRGAVPWVLARLGGPDERRRRVSAAPSMEEWAEALALSGVRGARLRRHGAWRVSLAKAAR
jgi:hypothetical protein